MIKLSSDMVELLRQCLKSNNPELLWVIETNDIVEVDEDLGNDLRDAVNEQFIKQGLKSNDEPNELGLKLERLIDEIGSLFMK